jgi:hypothetical protein
MRAQCLLICSSKITSTASPSERAQEKGGMQQTHPRWTPRVGCTKISVDAIVAKISTDEMVGEVCRRVVSSSIGCQVCLIQPPPDGLCMIKCHVSLKRGAYKEGGREA